MGPVLASILAFIVVLALVSVLTYSAGVHHAGIHTGVHLAGVCVHIRCAGVRMGVRCAGVRVGVRCAGVRAGVCHAGVCAGICLAVAGIRAGVCFAVVLAFAQASVMLPSVLASVVRAGVAYLSCVVGATIRTTVKSIVSN